MAPSISNCHYHEFPKDISFSGSGFLSTYQLGVALCFFKYAPWILRSAPCILGSSAGSLIAAAVVCEMNLITIRDELLLFAKKVMGFRLGPFHPSIDVFEWLKFVLHKYLPADAHCVANGRLGVAMTRLSDGKHFIMSEFQSKEDVIQALLCSCFVPGHSGFRPPTFKGVHYIDGGLSGMQPRLPDGADRTLTVCPFSGDADICPYDPPCVIEMVFTGINLKFNIANSFRILNGLYPVALETLEQAFHSGYEDANFFLRSNDLVPSVVTYKLPQSSLCSDQTNMTMQLENTKVEEEMKVEKETTLASFADFRSMQMVNSMDSETARDHLLHFDVVKNVLLGNVMAYQSIHGLTARILSNLLLPLVLVFSALLCIRQRLEMLFREMPDLIIWTWLSLKNCSVFFFSILICTMKKNVSERVMNIILLLQWLSLTTK